MGENSVQIIPYYAHPHVHTVIIDNTFYDETVAVPTYEEMPYATVVVTGADQGIDNTFVKLDDLQTKLSIFGRGDFDKYGQASLQADQLFNGSTSVWFCRVLPDNATYANLIVYICYRVGNILDESNQETGLKRLEVKFDCRYASTPATDDEVLYECALKGAEDNNKESAKNSYQMLPLFYVRSIGRGNYGNIYSMTVRRDIDAEKEYGCKMYKFGLITNEWGISKVTNIFSGSFYQTAKKGVSTLISDVLDQFSTGSCPIYIKPFEDSWKTLFNVYELIVDQNEAYLAQHTKKAVTEDELAIAKTITKETFDPIFGLIQGTRADEHIPYYRNYTTDSEGNISNADRSVPEKDQMPTNISQWDTAKVGMTLRVNNEYPSWHDGTTSPDDYSYEREIYKAAMRACQPGKYNAKDMPELQRAIFKRWLEWRETYRTYIYHIVKIDANGDIIYDSGEQIPSDWKEYNGVDISSDSGVLFAGGSDGDFEGISSNGTKRPPTKAEMKLLLAREQVKAFRGEKDRKILSPARTNVDFIFDANYNMTSDGELVLDDTIEDVYDNSTVLTDEDYRELESIVTKDVIDFTDINVKRAMYDLVDFRNRNGMTISEDMGAGCSLYLDCGLVGIKDANASSELIDTIDMFEQFTGRATSIDLGSYDIYDPYTGKRISVTAVYFIACNLVNHIMNYGLNKPFVTKYARLQTIQPTGYNDLTNSMIRGSFKPDIDLIDWDAKELMFTERVNYWITSNEGRVVERGCQNTRQKDASALLEENNVRVLNTLKKGLEEDCRGFLYEWNEPEARQSYTDVEMAIYEPWIGTMVDDLSISFQANAWEQERMIMHCYVSVAFRDIIKRIILEININRPEGNASA